MSGSLPVDTRTSEVLFNLSKGLSIKDSCKLSGLARSTFYSWMEDPEFERRVDAAKSVLLERAFSTIDKFIDEDPQLAMKIISRHDKLNESTVSGAKENAPSRFTLDVIPTVVPTEE